MLRDEREVDSEGHLVMLSKQLHRVWCPGAGGHQRRRGDDPILECPQSGLIVRVAHPEIIGIDNQKPSVVWISQQCVCCEIDCQCLCSPSSVGWPQTHRWQPASSLMTVPLSFSVARLATSS